MPHFFLSQLSAVSSSHANLHCNRCTGD